MQLRFALSSAGAFSKSDVNADVQGFYGTIYRLLSSPDEKVNVKQLLRWWNRRVFPAGRDQVLSEDSTLNFFHAAAKRRKAAEADAIAYERGSKRRRRPGVTFDAYDAVPQADDHDQPYVLRARRQSVVHAS